MQAKITWFTVLNGPKLHDEIR